MEKYSVILSAYECSPDHGSEAGVGTGSVVEKDVPDDEIWAGNPAKKIHAIEVNNNDETLY